MGATAGASSTAHDTCPRNAGEPDARARGPRGATGVSAPKTDGGVMLAELNPIDPSGDDLRDARQRRVGRAGRTRRSRPRRASSPRSKNVQGSGPTRQPVPAGGKSEGGTVREKWASRV